MADYPLQIATLAAELFDIAEIDRDPPSQGFCRKIIKGRTYWYEQTWSGRTRQQKLIGVETPELLAELARRRQVNSGRLLLRGRRQQLARALRAATGISIDPTSGRIVAQLAARGIFRAGAVLVGSHAFLCYGPMLARRFRATKARTGDVNVAVPDMVFGEVLRFEDAVCRADPAFTPTSTSGMPVAMKAGQARVDLLTPLRKDGKPWMPVFLPAFDFGAAQVPCLEYLLSNAVPALYPHRQTFLVKVPHPARYALHKLIVASQRDVAREHKALKDIAQAAELIAALAEHRPHDLRKAAAALVRAGPAHVKAAKRGAARLPDAVRALLPPPF